MSSATGGLTGGGGGSPSATAQHNSNLPKSEKSQKSPPSTIEWVSSFMPNRETVSARVDSIIPEWIKSCYNSLQENGNITTANIDLASRIGICIGWLFPKVPRIIPGLCQESLAFLSLIGVPYKWSQLKTHYYPDIQESLEEGDRVAAFFARMKVAQEVLDIFFAVFSVGVYTAGLTGRHHIPRLYYGKVRPLTIAHSVISTANTIYGLIMYRSVASAFDALKKHTDTVLSGKASISDQNNKLDPEIIKKFIKDIKLEKVENESEDTDSSSDPSPPKYRAKAVPISAKDALEHYISYSYESYIQNPIVYLRQLYESYSQNPTNDREAPQVTGINNAADHASSSTKNESSRDRKLLLPSRSQIKIFASPDRRKKIDLKLLEIDQSTDEEGDLTRIFHRLHRDNKKHENNNSLHFLDWCVGRVCLELGTIYREERELFYTFSSAFTRLVTWITKEQETTPEDQKPLDFSGSSSDEETPPLNEY